MNILVLTLSFGSGHIRAARAIATELKRRAPQAEVRVLDALANARWLFRALYVWPYWAMVRYAPTLWRKFFTARVERKAEQTAPAWAFRYGCPEVFSEILRLRPDTIIAVEVAACEMAVIARRSGMTSARLINVVTDYEAEPIWVKTEIDLYMVADERVRRQLSVWGAASEKIIVTGIPTDAVFSQQHDRATTRALCGIDDELPLVLLMGGGQGPTRMYEIAARLCQSHVPMHVVAVAGQDALVHKKLKRINPQISQVKLHVLGWTEDVAALMQAASLLVTKPGGLTLAEAARCALPVVMFNGIPGPETVNAECYVNAGAGVITHDVNETAAAVERLLLDEEERVAMSLCAARCARPGAASDVAWLALDEWTDTADLQNQHHKMTA